MSLLVFRTDSRAIVPTRGSYLSAGYDLSSIEECILLPGQRGCISTGLKLKIPTGYYGRVAPRSGLAVKNGIHVGAGVIDGDYLGVLKVVLFNLGTEEFIVTPGMRIAQLILKAYGDIPIVELKDEILLGQTERGEGGFGSTGTTPSKLESGISYFTS